MRQMKKYSKIEMTGFIRTIKADKRSGSTHSQRKITVKTVIEWTMLSKRSRGRPIKNDWKIAEGYNKLKEEVQQRRTGDVRHFDNNNNNKIFIQYNVKRMFTRKA